MWFDTHTHLSDQAFDEDREQLIADLPKEQVFYVLDVGTNWEDSAKAIANAKSHSAVYAAVGIHPDFIGQLQDHDLERLHELALSDKKVVAIGEIGLDYHYDVDPRDDQQKRMIEMMELAKELDKPVILHDREAHADTLKLIREHSGEAKGVLHSFSGSYEMAMEAIRLGYYISISGVITFKNEKKLKEMAPKLPQNRLLVETDSPCLAPVPFRGKRNQPAYVKYPGEKLADVLGIPAEECARITTENARRLFGV